MSDRLSMKFTDSNCTQRISPVMKVNYKAAASTPQSTSTQANDGKPASSWRAAYGNSNDSFPLKKGCGCGG
jgi:hypothetical protein